VVACRLVQGNSRLDVNDAAGYSQDIMTMRMASSSSGLDKLDIALTRPAPDRLILSLSGRLDTRSAGRLWRRLDSDLKDKAIRQLTLDLAELGYCDGSGAALILHFRSLLAERGGQFTLANATPAVTALVELYETRSAGATPPHIPARRGWLEKTGAGTRAHLAGVMELIDFIGQMTLAMAAALRRPHKVRWRDALVAAEASGVTALPIILILGFLIGLILAFQSAVPLRRFGADLFVANLVSLSLFRELGPLMTAVILAGRSGSAFAAELGTMKVKEEIDALTTMGLDPVRFLIVPRVIAAVAMTPLLTVFMILSGLVGAALVMISFGFPLVTFINQVLGAIMLADFLSGLAKSLMFGILVASIGCLRGLQTSSGASAVGTAATRAVVSGIILVVVADGIFAVLFYALGI